MLICWLNAALRSAQENLRRSEANFRSLVTNAPYGICSCDSTGKILDANPAFLELLGLSAPNDLVGQTSTASTQTATVVRTGGLLALSEPFQGLMPSGSAKAARPVVRVSGRAVSKGAKTASSSNFSPRTSPSAARSNSNSVSRKRWKPSAPRGRYRARLQQPADGDLRLLGISARTLGADADLRGPAQEIASAAERATSLTRQLLAFSRKQMLAPKVVNLNEIVTENLKMLTRMIGEDIDLVMVPGAELWPVTSRSRADRTGHHEPGRECARCHASRRQAHHRDREHHAR